MRQFAAHFAPTGRTAPPPRPCRGHRTFSPITPRRRRRRQPRRPAARGTPPAPARPPGYYGFSIEELSTYYYGYWWGYDSRTLSQDDEFGAFASLAFDFAMSPGSAFRIENKLHFVDFDGLDSLLTNESSVNGPIWTFEVGYVFKF